MKYLKKYKLFESTKEEKSLEDIGLDLDTINAIAYDITDYGEFRVNYYVTDGKHKKYIFICKADWIDEDSTFKFENEVAFVVERLIIYLKSHFEKIMILKPGEVDREEITLEQLKKLDLEISQLTIHIK